MIRFRTHDGTFWNDPKGITIEVKRAGKWIRVVSAKNRMRDWQKEKNPEQWEMATTLTEEVFPEYANLSSGEQLLRLKEYAAKINRNEWDWWIPCSYYENFPHKRARDIRTMGNCYSLGLFHEEYIYERNGQKIKDNPFPIFNTVEDIFLFIMAESRKD